MCTNTNACSSQIYYYNYTARTDVLPGKVRFDCAGPMFCEFPRVVRLGKRMTIFPSFHQHHYHHHHHHHHHHQHTSGDVVTHTHSQGYHPLGTWRHTRTPIIIIIIIIIIIFPIECKVQREWEFDIP